MLPAATVNGPDADDYNIFVDYVSVSVFFAVLIHAVSAHTEAAFVSGFAGKHSNAVAADFSVGRDYRPDIGFSYYPAGHSGYPSCCFDDCADPQHFFCYCDCFHSDVFVSDAAVGPASEPDVAVPNFFAADAVGLPDAAVPNFFAADAVGLPDAAVPNFFAADAAVPNLFAADAVGLPDAAVGPASEPDAAVPNLFAADAVGLPDAAVGPVCYCFVDPEPEFSLVVGYGGYLLTGGFAGLRCSVLFYHGYFELFDVDGFRESDFSDQMPDL